MLGGNEERIQIYSIIGLIIIVFGIIVQTKSAGPKVESSLK